MTNIIDGKKISADVLADITDMVTARKKNNKPVPGLAVVIVGSDPASKVYVNSKNTTCKKLGFNSFSHELDENTSETTLLALIDELNNNDKVHGILVQMPLPKTIDSKKVIRHINPAKDVDGFHPYNAGLLATGSPGLSPCTPRGVMQVLESIGVTLRGKIAVVIGASNIVGVPMSLELLNKRATTVICHSGTVDLPAEVRRADIVVAAVGMPNFVRGDWVKEGAIVIDVGINRTENGKLCGDVNYAEVMPKASYITPVPGGIGPLTISTLMLNTYEACVAICGE